MDYASFHKGHGGSHGGGGGGAGHQGGHYQVHGAHHGHADDATSWRRDVLSPARGGAAGAAPAGEGDRPLPPARPPHVRRMSAGPGAPLTAPEGRDAPGSPFHHWGTGQPAAAREHVAVGPTAGSGFGFGRGHRARRARVRAATLCLGGTPPKESALLMLSRVGGLKGRETLCGSMLAGWMRCGAARAWRGMEGGTGTRGGATANGGVWGKYLPVRDDTGVPVMTGQSFQSVHPCLS